MSATTYYTAHPSTARMPPAKTMPWTIMVGAAVVVRRGSNGSRYALGYRTERMAKASLALVLPTFPDAKVVKRAAE